MPQRVGRARGRRRRAPAAAAAAVGALCSQLLPPAAGQCTLPAVCATTPSATRRNTCIEGMRIKPVTQPTTSVVLPNARMAGGTSQTSSDTSVVCSAGQTTGGAATAVCKYEVVQGYSCIMPSATYDPVGLYHAGTEFSFVCRGSVWYDAGGVQPCTNLAGANRAALSSGQGTNSGADCVPICTPITCAPYSLSDRNMISGDTNPGPQCANPETNICNVDTTTLGYTPTGSCAKQCAITCAPGYHDVSQAGSTNSAGKGWLQCNDAGTAGAVAAEPTITCEANQCSPYYLPAGTIGSGAFPCYNGTVLSTSAINGGNTTCELQCREGYGVDPGTATNRLPAQSVVCRPGSEVGAPPVSMVDGSGPAATLLGAALTGCRENKCKAFSLDAVAQCSNGGRVCLTQGSTGVACPVTANAVTLTTITEPSCTLACATGYLATTTSDLTISCRLEAVNGETEVTLSPGGFRCQATCRAWFDAGNGCASPRSTKVGRPEQVVCAGGDFTQCSRTACCQADCTISAHAAVNGVDVTTLSPAACVAGGLVPNGTQCTWSVKRGYMCSGGSRVQTCASGRTITQLADCVPTCASLTCSAANYETQRSSTDPNTVVCAGTVCTAAECCNAGCSVPQFGADVRMIGTPPGVAPLALTPADVCGDGTAARWVSHGTQCSFQPVTNARCQGTGLAVCRDGVWVGDWTATALPSCLPYCGVEDNATRRADPPGLEVCTDPFTRKSNPGSIVCGGGVCDDATCCNADCPTHYTDGAWLLGVGCPNAMPTNYGSGTLPVYHGTTCTWRAQRNWNCSWVGAVYCNDGNWVLPGTTTARAPPQCSPLCSGHTCFGALVPIPTSATTVCTSGTCTDNLCCLEPCEVQSIPLYDSVPMAAVIPAACIPGSQLLHGSECTWTPAPGFFCENAGKSICNNQVWTQPTLNCTPTCSVHRCAPTPATPPARDSTLKANAGSIVCSHQGCTHTRCCDAPCTVQSLPLDQTYKGTVALDVGPKNVPMITLDSQCNGLLSSDGYTGLQNAAVSGTVCTWASVPGYSCTGLGTTTCVDGVWSQPLPVCTPLCQSYHCGTAGSNLLPRARNCPNCLLKADQGTRKCSNGICNDHHCCDAACDTPAEPLTNGSGVTVRHAVLVAPCMSMRKASVKHGQLCSWRVQHGYDCDNDDPWICNDGSQATVPLCYATCGNTGSAWANADCSRRTGFLPKANRESIRCGRDMSAPGDACTEEICCDFACDHPAFQCPTGFTPKVQRANIRCGATLSHCTPERCCEAATCPANAGPPGECGCNPGYGAFPAVAWSPGTGMWTHKCHAMCNHPSGPCQGAALVAKSPVPMCSGTDPVGNCSTQQCCDVACTAPGFTACSGTRGLALKANASQIACGRSAALCSVQRCCWATCDSIDFSGCSATSAATGWVLKAAAAAIPCSSHSGAACTRGQCCDATVCSNHVCARGWSRKADAHLLDCQLRPCTDALCCVDNVCAAPSATAQAGPTAVDKCYTFGDGTGQCTTVSSCSPVLCRPGCTGVPNITCDLDGGSFSIAGCRPNQCTPPRAAYPGYDFAGGRATCDNINTCGVISCAAGYHFEIPLFSARHLRALQADRSYSAPSCFCDEDGGSFQCYGCFENQCTPPLLTSSLLGYRFDGDPATCTRRSTCRVRGCRSGYLRDANPLSIACPTHGGVFSAAGCSPITCPQWARTTAAAVCECSPGYRYVRSDGVQAPLWSGTQWMHTCGRVACPQFSETTATDPCRCREGYSGVPLWDAATGSWLHRCSLAACPPNAQRVCDGFGSCTCPCNVGFITSGQGVAWNFTQQRWTHNCSSACPRGFTYDESKATWDGVQWKYACVEAECPDRAARVAASDGSVSCVCGAGWEGAPRWNAAKLRWDHICGPPRSSVPCPTFAGPQGRCECPDGYRTTNQAGSIVSGPLWTGTQWGHNCTRVGCPPNSDWGAVLPGTRQACVCIAGFSGTPVWSVTQQAWSHTCVPGGGGGSSAACTNGLCSVQFSPIVIPAALSSSSTFVQGGYVNVIPAASRAVSCLPDSQGLLTLAQVDTAGVLRLVPALGQAGSTTVRCTVRDGGAAVGAFSFVVTVVGSTPAPGGTGAPVFWQRLQLTPSTPFRRSAFAAAIQQISSRPLKDVRVWYVCPASACPGGVCPTTHQGREAAGCASEEQIPFGRRPQPLQAGQRVGEVVYVDFQAFAADESLPDTAVQQQGAADLQSEVSRCAAGQSCVFTGMASQVGGAGLAPAVTSRVAATPTPGASSDDGSLGAGAIAGIVIACVVVCLLLLLLLWLCARSAKGKNKGEAEGASGEGYESRGQQLPSQTEAIQPFYQDVQDFQPDQPVRALYEGEWHEGRIWTKDADGTYTVTWMDGTHTTGVPPEQVVAAGSVTDTQYSRRSGAGSAAPAPSKVARDPDGSLVEPEGSQRMRSQVASQRAMSARAGSQWAPAAPSGSCHAAYA